MTKKDRTDYGQYLFIDGDNVSTGSDDEENGCVEKTSSQNTNPTGAEEDLETEVPSASPRISFTESPVIWLFAKAVELFFQPSSSKSK